MVQRSREPLVDKSIFRNTLQVSEACRSNWLSRYSGWYPGNLDEKIFVNHINYLSLQLRSPRLSNLRYQCICERQSALEIWVHSVDPTGRTSMQPRSGLAHPTQNLRLTPFPVVHFPKILPSPVSRCVSLPSVLVSPRRCQPNDTTLTGRSGKQLSGRPYGGCTCGHACVRRILLFPPVCQPTYSCHPPFDSGGCRPSNGSNSC